MAVKTKQGQWGASEFIETTPKKSRQGSGKHTKYSATSRNGKKRPIEDKGDDSFTCTIKCSRGME